MSENTKNTTKNTLVEAENVALRAELDEANKKIKSIESGNRQDAEQRKIIAALTKNTALDKKRIAELAAKQLTAEQITNLRGYDRLSAFSSEQSGKLSALTGKYNQAVSKLEDADGRFKDNDKRIEKLNSMATEAESRRKKYKKRMMAGIIAAAFFTTIIGGGSYYYVETELMPADALSPEAADAFRKHAPEYRKIISEATAQERERLRIASNELMAEKMNFDRDKPGWFSSYGMPLIYVIGGIIFGFLIGLGTVLKLIK
jgi:DNA repair exonuclease SbcCD ATPase subunit